MMWNVLIAKGVQEKMPSTKIQDLQNVEKFCEKIEGVKGVQEKELRCTRGESADMRDDVLQGVPVKVMRKCELEMKPEERFQSEIEIVKGFQVVQVRSVSKKK